MNEKNYFLKPNSTAQKQYEALRAYFVDNISAAETAKKNGYTLRAFTSLVADFRKKRRNNPDNEIFFQVKKPGRKIEKKDSSIISKVISLRKAYLSVPDIKVVLNGKNIEISEKKIYLILKDEGFARLPRRSKKAKQESSFSKIVPEKSSPLQLKSDDTFSSNSIGIMLFWPIIRKFGIDAVIENSAYPATTTISKFSSIMSFLALKLSNIRRYSADDIWCMDRGQGFFAQLNVLPKNAWFSSYSHRIRKEDNLAFLRELHKLWIENGLLGDTINLDFTTIPYWGDNGHLENNWSGKRRHALSSMLAVLAQDPDSGIIDYGDADIVHKNESAVVLEFLDFYRESKKKKDLEYLVFDSKFTNYQNLSKLDDENIKFVTIRRRGKKIVDEVNNFPASKWVKKRVPCAGNKVRNLRVNDSILLLKGYDKKIRQIAITGHGKIKPALIITNDFELKTEDVVRKYTKRWIVEKSISEQIDFFHLNRVSSSMVIKVDFDLTMTILAHNLYRLLADKLDRYSHYSDIKIYEQFIMNSGEINIFNDQVHVMLKKKKNLPLVLSIMEEFSSVKYPWLKNRTLEFRGMSNS